MLTDFTKGTQIDLKKVDPTMTKVRVGLVWGSNKYHSGFNYDLDVTAFVLKQDDQGNRKLLSERYMIFYNQLISPEGAVKHLGDDTSGDNYLYDDNETIIVDLSLLPAAADEISFVVTIHEAIERKQNFGLVSNSYIKLYNEITGKVVAQYNLEDDFSTETAVQFGSLYKKDGQWLFKAIGQGFNVGLREFCEGYGGNVA